MKQIVCFVRPATIGTAFLFILLLSSCLLFYPEPKIEEIEDQTISLGEKLEVPLYAESDGKKISYTYQISKQNGENSGSGWEKIEGSTFIYTFTESGMYLVTIIASNGLREASTSFTATVNEVADP